MKIDMNAVKRVMSYESIIRDVAQRYGLPTSLMLAICYVESRGNPDAYNESSMATGLFQIIPAEAGGPLKDRPTIEELKDPETNAEWGCIILDWFRKVEGGSRLWGLFRYSGGITWFRRVNPNIQRHFANYSDMTQLRKTQLAFNQFLFIYWRKVVNVRKVIVEEMRKNA